MMILLVTAFIAGKPFFVMQQTTQSYGLAFFVFGAFSQSWCS